ncbi:hypothetical protein [Streptomyces sp. CB03911]|nr:hypothetical protein [Streptomyces sp. CB03911]OKI21846.1 hypothetical protein A6A07_35360 [Streptomyces sp. CB03911]
MASGGDGIVLRDAVFHGTVNFTTNITTAAGADQAEQVSRLLDSQQQVIGLMTQLLDSQRQIRDLKDQLHRAHDALDTALRIADAEPSGEGLRRAVARALDQGALPARPSPQD